MIERVPYGTLISSYDNSHIAYERWATIKMKLNYFFDIVMKVTPWLRDSKQWVNSVIQPFFLVSRSSRSSWPHFSLCTECYRHAVFGRPIWRKCGPVSCQESKFSSVTYLCLDTHWMRVYLYLYGNHLLTAKLPMVWSYTYPSPLYLHRPVIVWPLLLIFYVTTCNIYLEYAS
jgi:hypothetical protein